MLDFSTLKDNEISAVIENRWESSGELWVEIEKSYKKNKNIWKNKPEYLDKIPNKRSKTRDNRTFLAVETVITNLTGRPSKPNVIGANDSEDGKIIAEDLQDFFLEKYRILSTKKKLRKGLRHLFFSRLITLKVFWNKEKDDFDIKTLKPTQVRFSKNATGPFDTEFAIEEIEITVDGLIDMFSDKEKEIIAKCGYTKQQIIKENPKVKYKEAWIGDWVFYKYQDIILKKEKHPYWDWNGILTHAEDGDLSQIHGRRRRDTFKSIKGFQDYRKKALENGRTDYKQYQYNHFDKPIPPYIFGTVLEVEDSPAGETTLIDEVEPLQEAIDVRKRQFQDNADMMNGIWKVDTSICSGLSKEEAIKMKADPKGIIYGKGVRNGVTRETGKELPSFLQDDMAHSINELDSIFGTNNTFRGEQGKGETATGRAILREQGFQRLDELIDLVDFIHWMIYNWQFQLMKVRYTERHYLNLIGKMKAEKVISLMQDDFDEGIEIKIIPGQVLPEDRLYKSEKALEALKANAIVPLTYFEMAGWDEPMKQAKRLEMYKINPFSIIDLDEKDKKKLKEAMELFGKKQEDKPPIVSISYKDLPPDGQVQAAAKAGLQIQPPAPAAGANGGADPRAAQLAELRTRAEQMVKSPEFQKLPEEEQRSAIEAIKTQIQNLIQTNK